jgi:hypothetical protein
MIAMIGNTVILVSIFILIHPFIKGKQEPYTTPAFLHSTRARPLLQSKEVQKINLHWAVGN